ncbi:MAG: glycine cleavage system protein GcvH [Candidatus Lokiarchaeia archaeon]|nr:glycine cleavage system protein GcvH [Candidatus Lokiarchaeia archaeon]
MEHKLPNNLKYTSTHEWIKLEDSIAIVGITDFAQHQLGDIVFVELPEIGMVFEKGSNAAEIESVKAVGDLIMPLSGEIIAINDSLANNPELVNSSPYEKGWMIKIKFSHPSEIDELLSNEEYKDIIQNEKD